MNCIICESPIKFFLSKEYTEEPYSLFMKDIGPIEYFKCINCGFTMGKTIIDLSHQRWEMLNSDFHHYQEKNNSAINQPPYLHQATFLKVLSTNGIIDINSTVDYAGGYGSLSKVMNKYFEMQLAVYDPFVQGNTKDIYVPKESLKNYSSVLSSALFEHLTNRESFDNINNIVSDSGFMFIHTVICENIPNDPNWFYMDPPVHCAFQTNKSMQILMDQWDYRASIYCPVAKSWVLFKENNPDVKRKVDLINSEFQTEYIIHKEGFVDYWKGF